jgi:hypothetical protein
LKRSLVLLLAAVPALASVWTVYIANTACVDYTWVLDEAATKSAVAELVRAHLDEMKRTDALPDENRDRYNMMVLQEAVFFLDRYPERRDEFLRRVKEGRIYVSPFLNNTLWGLQSTEGAIRSFLPARRLERDWGVRFDTAAHIELPSLPWGMASILAGAGFRWLAVPYYDYDSTFSKLEAPPLFNWEGPDGAKIRVVLDHWASQRGSYAQGDQFLKDLRGKKAQEWIDHYRALRPGHPVQAILANGTHSDLSFQSGDQVAGFARSIEQANQEATDIRLVNASFGQFFREIDAAEAKSPFLPAVRGDFGHSWEVWPVSLAKYVGLMRTAERHYLAAEALLSILGASRPEALIETRAMRDAAEWDWAMLADHAWNGSDPANKLENLRLRKAWSERFDESASKLDKEAWSRASADFGKREYTIFNSASYPRKDLVSIDAEPGFSTGQRVEEDGAARIYFVSPEVAAFSLATRPLDRKSLGAMKLRAASSEIDGPFYSLRVDPGTGGLSSLYHKPTRTELATDGGVRTIGQAIYFDGLEHRLSDVRSEVVAAGPVLARLRVSGHAGEVRVTTSVTAYAELDRVDFDVRIDKPATTRLERLTHSFPVPWPDAAEHIDTTGAVIRPEYAPAGDRLPGADPNRMAVQYFVDASRPGGPGVTIAPQDAFALRRDLGRFTFEALGNDQNYKEMIQDQGGVTHFRFRYSLRVHPGPFDNAEAAAWSRGVTVPMLVVKGRVATPAASIEVDSRRAVALCLKPAEGQGTILRLWETSGRSGPAEVRMKGYNRAIQTDLLERDGAPLPIVDGKVLVPLAAHGYSSLRLIMLSRSPGPTTSSR